MACYYVGTFLSVWRILGDISEYLATSSVACLENQDRACLLVDAGNLV